MATMCVVLLMANCTKCGKHTWHVATSKGYLDCLVCRAVEGQEIVHNTHSSTLLNSGDTKDASVRKGAPTLAPTD